MAASAYFPILPGKKYLLQEMVRGLVPPLSPSPFPTALTQENVKCHSIIQHEENQLGLIVIEQMNYK